MTEDDARAMLNGKSPFEAQGKIPALPTPPAARDWKDGSAPKPHGKHSASLPQVMADRGHKGRLSPEFVEWVMGFPIGWTACTASETP